MGGSMRATRVDRVADVIGQVEVDCGLALVAFSDGRVHATERTLRLARERLNRAIATLRTRGSR